MNRASASTLQGEVPPTTRGQSAVLDDRPTVAPVRRPPVSVVICAYCTERWPALFAAVDSVARQTVRPQEIIVVIDHNPELEARAAAELPSAAGDLMVTVVSNAKAPGLSGARNSGVERARGQVVAFLDDDARAAPNWIERLGASYHDPEVIGVGGRVVPEWQGNRPRWFPPEFDWVVGCTHKGMISTRGPVRNMVGANMSFRRSVFDRVGGFRVDLGRVGTRPVGCEETELCIRATRQLSATQVLYDPTACVVHAVPEERASFRYFRSRCFSEGISKAAVSRIAGTGPGLSAERRYLRTVLPRAVFAALGEVVRGRPSRLARAGAVVAGTAMTTAGFVAGRRSAPSTALSPMAPGEAATLPGAPFPDRGPAWATPATLLLASAALATWIVSLLTPVDLGKIGQLGLVTVLPVSYWVSLVLLATAAGLAVTTRRPVWILAAISITLVVVLHATPSILYGSLRYSWAWKHVAVVDFYLRNWQFKPSVYTLNAYQAWPGFFTANAAFDSAAGLRSAFGYAPWSEAFFEVLYLIPLAGIIRTFTDDRRVTWTAVWIFYLGNWIGQDYFSPQAADLFLYLVVLALVLRYLLPSARTALVAPLQAAADAPVATQGRALVFLVPLVVAVASIHPLTPLMLISTLAVLWIFRQRIPLRVLVLAVVATGGWIAIGARTFLHDNFYWIARSIGSLGSASSVTAHSALVNYAALPPDQIIIADIDRALSASIVIMAVAGVLRRRREGKSDLRFLLLAIAPLPMIFANDYGGEILFRVYLFILPFLAVLAACLLFPSIVSGRSPWMVLPVSLLFAVLSIGFVFCNDGKEQVDYFNPSEIAAGKWIVDHTPPGSTIVSANDNWPYSYQNFDHHIYQWFVFDSVAQRKALVRHPVVELARLLPHIPPDEQFIVFNPTATAGAYSEGELPIGSLAQIQAAFLNSRLFQVVFRNATTLVLQGTTTLPGIDHRPSAVHALADHSHPLLRGPFTTAPATGTSR